MAKLPVLITRIDIDAGAERKNYLVQAMVHSFLPMKCTPEQYEQFQRDGNKLKIKPIDHGER